LLFSLLSLWERRAGVVRASEGIALRSLASPPLTAHRRFAILREEETAMAEPVQPSTPPRKRRKLGFVLLLLLLVPILLFALYVWLSLNFNYSDGERAGYVQKLSRRGWLCKTWEGELAMVNLPGAMPEVFRFSVRDDAVASRVNETLGRRVRLHYEQHKGIPTSCFGETEYFVTAVEPVGP